MDAKLFIAKIIIGSLHKTKFLKENFLTVIKLVM